LLCSAYVALPVTLLRRFAVIVRQYKRGIYAFQHGGNMKRRHASAASPTGVTLGARRRVEVAGGVEATVEGR